MKIFSRERQMASIPHVLLQLLQFLLEGGTCNDKNYTTCSSNIANNFSQLIWYNAVKYRRRDA